MNARLSTPMKEVLRLAAQRGKQGALGHTNRKTEDALEARGLITWEHNVTDEDGEKLLYPVLTPTGWAASGIARPADEGRMTLEDAWDDAVIFRIADLPSERISIGGRAPEDVAPRSDDLPAGTRVRVTAGRDAGRLGTVLDGERGSVTNQEHENYGRAWVPVMLDARDGQGDWDRKYVRPFVDELVELASTPTTQEAHDAERAADEEWFLIQSAQEMDAEAGWLRAAETHPETGWDGTD